MSQPSSSKGLQRTALIASLWLLLSVASLALSASFEGTTVRSALLPDPLRRSLVSFELCALALVVAAVGGALILLWQVLDTALRSSGQRRVAWVIVSLLASAPLGLYGISWATYASTGRFLDASGIDFMRANPLQFLQHVAHIDAQLLLVVPLLLMAATLLFTWLLPMLLSRLAKHWLWLLQSLVATLVALCLFQASDWRTGELADSIDYIDPDEAVIDPDAGLIYTYGDLYVRSRDDGSGPIAHAYADLRRAYGQGPAPLDIDPSIAVERRPIVSMDDYLATVDPDAVKRQNVLIVVIESLRPDQLLSFGGKRLVMPTLESIAAESRRYSDHYAQASHSNYADMCLLSSHYPLRSERAHVYPKNPTYPRVMIYDVLEALGWHTAVVSSQNESWGKMINYLRTGSIEHFFHSESFDGETYVPRNDEGFQDFLSGSKRSGKIDDRFTISEAIRWIDEVDDGRPFFMYLNLQNSHLPYETPADFPRRFGPEEIDFVIRFSGYPKVKAGVVKDLYADSLAYVDFQLARLVEHLKQRGQWENTIVAVTGDTGQAFGEHGFVAHANMIFDEVVRVPLMIKAPGLEPGTDRRPAQHIDLPPSILDLLGMAPHSSWQGISLIAPDPDPARYRYIMVQTPIAHQYGIIWRRFKLIYDANFDRQMLLDRVADPTEMTHVGPRYPAIQKKLRDRLDTWRQLQLEYYRDTKLHSARYPPVLSDD